MQPPIEQLSAREQRAIMLEQQTPAYALTSEARRAIDLKYRRAKHLRQAFRDAGIDVPVHTLAIVPHQHQYVSGLNVLSNLQTVVGRDDRRKFNRIMDRAKKALEARNA